MKHTFAYAFGAAFAAYVGWVVLSTDANQRIERGCAPVNWMGNVSVSLVAFVNPTWEAGTQRAFDYGNYVCRFTVWRLVYGAEWTAAHPGAAATKPKPETPGNGARP